MRTRHRLTSLPLVSAILVSALGLAWAGCSSDTTESTPAGGGTTTATGTGGAGQGGAGQGGEGGQGGQGGAVQSSPVQARFALPPQGAPAFLDVPFPSDVYRGADGMVGDIVGLETFFPKSTDFLKAGLAGSNGFGTTAGALFRIDDTTGDPAAPPPADLDAASFPADEAASTGAGATAMIVDLEAKDAASALVPARVEYHDDRSIGAKARPLLAVFPARGVVLAEGRRYAVVLTTGIRAKDGKALAPSADFVAVRDGAKRASDTEKLYGEAADQVAKLVPALADKSKIAALAVYTTHAVSQELADLRAELGKQKAPALSWDAAAIAPMGAALFANEPLPAGFTATLDAWLGMPVQVNGADDPAGDSQTGRAHDALAAVGTAVFDAPNFLVEDEKGFASTKHHLFSRDASGKAIQNPDKKTSKVWMTIALPKGDVPPNGFPTVVLQHGLSQDRSLILAFANTFAQKGWATVAIESVTFGARAPVASKAVDAKVGLPWSAGDGAYDGPDGFVDERNGSGDFFGGLQSLGGCRDQMRQSVLDLATTIDMVRDASFDLGPLKKAVPSAKLDGAKVAYVGNSLGAIMGSILASVEPNVKTYVLNVVGGGLMVELGTSSPYISDSLKLAGSLNYGFGKNRFTPGHPLVQTLQHVLDGGDPLLYARHLTVDPMTVGGAKLPAKNVLQIEVAWDEIVANSANEAFARAAGFPLASPSLGSLAGVPLATATPVDGIISGVPVAGTTAVLVQAGPAVHGADLYNAKSTHTYAIPFPRFELEDPFPKLPAEVEVEQPYLTLQAASVTFIEGDFAGAVPSVGAFGTPVMDYDGDGVEDAKDADPNDPAKQ